jgi:tetratricopeptide (TPR) repeat protein
MDGGILALIIPAAVLAGGAVGWLIRQYRYRRESQRQAAHDASETLKDKKTTLEDMISKIEDAGQKEELQLQLDEVNTALLGLHSERLRRTLKAAGLPPEEALIADGLSQLQPQQVAQLNKEITEVKGLPQSDSVQELSTLAAAFYYAGQYEAARETLNRMLELRPDDPDTLTNRGVILSELKRYDEALIDYNRSLELRPDHPATLTNRGSTYDELGRYDEALADYNRSLELKPDDPDTLYNRGNTYAKLERYDEALADYNRSLELRPDHPDTLTNHGVTL